MMLASWLQLGIAVITMIAVGVFVVAKIQATTSILAERIKGLTLSLDRWILKLEATEVAIGDLRDRVIRLEVRER